MSTEKMRASFRLLMLIATPKLTDKALLLFEKGKLPMQLQAYAHGTASREMMDMLGLDSGEKSLLLTMMPKTDADDLLIRLRRELRLGLSGSGIAFTVPISGANKRVLQMVQQVCQEKPKPEMRRALMQENDYQIIVALVNQGYSEEVMAAAQFHEEHPDSRMEIFIVDSHAYSMAEGAGVIEAKQKLDAGETMESVIEYLNDKYAKMEILLTAYTLKVIRKSGRISAAAAIAGDLLGIHPIFTLNDGVSQVVKKVRGDKAVVSGMATAMASRMAQGTPYYIGVSDHKYDEEYVEACTKKVGYAPVGIFHLGCAVLSNTGAEAVGLVFEGAKRER